MSIEKLIYGFQPEQIGNFEIFFTIFLISTIYLFFFKIRKFYIVYFFILFIYIFLFVFLLSTNEIYEGTDRFGICGWLELSDQLQNGQSAYSLQANRFIQGEDYIKNLKISFYYPPPYILLYDFLCKLDNNIFNYVNILGFVIVALLAAKILDKNKIEVFIIIFTGLSSSLWMVRQGQVVFVELFFLVFSLYCYNKKNYYLGHLFFILFGLSRLYFLVLIIPILIFRNSKKEYFFTFFLGLFLIILQWELWADYFNLWLGVDGYLFGDVTTYSNRTSLFDEHLGRYAFSLFLVLRYFLNTFANIEWAETLIPTLSILLFVIVTSNFYVFFKFKNKNLLFRILVTISLNFLLYPVLKPYILTIYLVATVFLFKFKNELFVEFSMFLFCIAGVYGHIVTNIISSTFSMEIYQLVILSVHFVLSFNKKFEKLK